MGSILPFLTPFTNRIREWQGGERRPRKQENRPLSDQGAKQQIKRQKEMIISAYITNVVITRKMTAG